MEEDEGLEGLEIARLEKEALELRIKITLQGLIPGGEDGDIVSTDGVFESVEKESLLHQLGKLGIMRVEESNEDGVGIDLATGVCGLLWQC